MKKISLSILLFLSGISFAYGHVHNRHYFFNDEYREEYHRRYYERNYSCWNEAGYNEYGDYTIYRTCGWR